MGQAGRPVKESGEPEVKRFLSSESTMGLVFILPWLLGFLIFMVAPLCASFYYAFCDFDIVSDPIFVGLRNFHELTMDKTFMKALLNTFYFMGTFIPMLLVCSVLFAVGIESCPKRWQGFLTSTVFFPSLVPVVATSMIFLLLFNVEYGYLNRFLGLFGMSGIDWLADPSFTKLSVLIGSLWGLGGAVVINLAALREIPRTLYEAAELDGAGPVSRFIHITLPLLTPALFFHITMGLIAAIQLFALPFILYGPYGSTDRSALFAIPYLYETAFSFQEFGYACAMAWVLFTCLIAINGLVIFFIKPLVIYERG